MTYFKSKDIGNYFYDVKLDSGEEDIGTEKAKAFDKVFKEKNQSLY
jgi:hypothetical protein